MCILCWWHVDIHKGEGSVRGEGSKNLDLVVDVINEWPLNAIQDDKIGPTGTKLLDWVATVYIQGPVRSPRAAEQMVPRQGTKQTAMQKLLRYYKAEQTRQLRISGRILNWMCRYVYCCQMTMRRQRKVEHVMEAAWPDHRTSPTYNDVAKK